MKTLVLCMCLSLLTRIALAADQPLRDRGRQEEHASCVPCHSLRLVDSQRLSVAAWQKEIDKMIGWGAVVPDRQLLLDYLSQEYSANNPVPPPELSGDGSIPRKKHP